MTMAWYSKDLLKIMNKGFADAREQRYELMSVEYFLLTLLENASAVELLSNSGVDLELLRKDLNMYIADNTSVLDKTICRETQPSLAYQRVLEKAAYQAAKSGSEAIIGANVLIAIFSEEDSHAVRLLKKHGATRLDALEYFTFLDRPTDEEVRSRPLHVPLWRMPARLWGRLVHRWGIYKLMSTGNFTGTGIDNWIAYEKERKKNKGTQWMRRTKANTQL